MTNQNQLELGLAGANHDPRNMKLERRLNHANWWFNQMRQIVDQAFEMEPAPRFQMEQTWLTDDQKQNRG